LARKPKMSRLSWLLSPSKFCSRAAIVWGAGAAWGTAPGGSSRPARTSRMAPTMRDWLGCEPQDAPSGIRTRLQIGHFPARRYAHGYAASVSRCLICQAGRPGRLGRARDHVRVRVSVDRFGGVADEGRDLRPGATLRVQDADAAMAQVMRAERRRARGDAGSGNRPPQRGFVRRPEQLRLGIAVLTRRQARLDRLSERRRQLDPQCPPGLRSRRRRPAAQPATNAAGNDPSRSAGHASGRRTCARTNRMGEAATRRECSNGQHPSALSH
jgi:hypothetical protein